jgi:lipopolysaccharide transport system ATP-binding protein
VPDSVICVENLSKRYLINHHKVERYKTMRDLVANRVKSLSGRLRGSRPQGATDKTQEAFWALKEVSFEIRQGDRVGIIGQNGAGKSTLLKILSRITEPTIGRIAIQGRVASLLEVGTGFHPELTGRENIFLNGAILGMNREEIKRKFDEIVAFAEVEKFLDTPVKHYSSGMYVRLAFAVAAHLEPEILIVDEVLAVGDIRFQKKCLGKMKEVEKQGRTVLFVSHNMNAIQSLCERCLVFQAGKLIADQNTAEAIQTYLRDTSISNSFSRPPQTNGNPSITFGELKCVEKQFDSEVQIDLEIYAKEFKLVSLDLRLADATGSTIAFGSLGALDPTQMLNLEPGTNHISLLLPTHQLATGTYFIHLDLTLPDREYYDRLENCLVFEVIRPLRGTQTRAMMQNWGYGSFELPLLMLSKKS